MLAHVVNGVVLRLIDDNKLIFYPPAIRVEFVAANSDTEIGDLWDGASFSKPSPPPPIQQDYEVAIQCMLDDAARLNGYDDIVSACTYAGTANPFQAEGQAFLVWRANVWQYCYAQLNAVQSGEREPLAIATLLDEIMAILPAPV